MSQKMTTKKMIHCFEEAAELGDRFPDHTEFEVLTWVSDICQLSAPIEPQWAVARCVIAAYEHASAEVGLQTAKVWGIVPQDTEYDSNQLYI